MSGKILKVGASSKYYFKQIYITYQEFNKMQNYSISINSVANHKLFNRCRNEFTCKILVLLNIYIIMTIIKTM